MQLNFMTFSNFAPVALYHFNENAFLINMNSFFFILMDWFPLEIKINGVYKELLSPNFTYC